MELRQLQHLVAVVEHGSFSRAALALGIGQPGLTKSVRRLEASLGVRLLERRARGVEPTDLGAILVRHAKLIEVERREALAEFEAVLGGRVGTVSLGAGPAWLTRHLPGALARLHRDHPGIRVRVVGGYPEDLLAHLRQGDLDVVLGAVPEEPADPQVEAVTLASDEQVAIARAGHPLHAAGRVEMRRLLDFPWVLAPPQTRVRQKLQAKFVEHGLRPPDPVVQSDSLSFAMALLRESEFLGVATREALEREEAAGLVALDCPDLVFRRATGVIHRSRGTLPAAARALVDAVIAEVRAPGRA